MFNKDVLNFHVEKFDLGAFNLNFGGVDGGKIDPSLGVGLRRSDTKEPIAIVSDSYEPVQYLALVENLEQSISDKIGLNVIIKNNKRNRGTITLSYHDIEQLNKIIDIIKSNY